MKNRIAHTCDTMLIVFIILKLTGQIDWGWSWVLAPFWIPFVLVLIIKATQSKPGD